MGSLVRGHFGSGQVLSITERGRLVDGRFARSLRDSGASRNCSGGSQRRLRSSGGGGFGQPLSQRLVPNRFLLDPLLGENNRVRAQAYGGEHAGSLEAEAAWEPSPEAGEEEELLSLATLLWRTAKLPMYSVAIIPLTVGAAAAFWQTGNFNGARCGLMLWSSVLIITWLNMSNDAYDAETGVDKFKKESLVNITGSQKGVLGAAYAFLAVGLGGLIRGAIQTGDMRVTVLLILAVACGYVYQCPPFRLSYKGLGEPLCFFAFGPFATTAFYLSQSLPSGTGVLPVTLAIFGASVIVGMSTSLILFCSHFHQIEGDKLAGKISPLVRLGTENASKVVQAVVIGLYAVVAALSIARAVPLSCSLFSLLTLPIGKLVTDFVKNNHADKQMIFMAKYYAVRLHVAFGLAMTLGFSLAHRLPLPALI